MGRVMMVVRPSKGGAFGHVRRLAGALLERGHEVAIAGPHGAQREALEGIELVELDIGRAIAPREDLAAIRDLARAYRSWRPDLVHAHGSKGGVAARFARLAAPRVPVVFTPHNYAFTNYFASRGSQRAYRVIETAMAPLASRTLCVCKAERALAAGIGAGRRARVVYNGIEPMDPAEPSPEVERLAVPGPLVCAVTEFQLPKGVPTLIEAMPAVLAAHPGAQLALAGDGPMRDEIVARIAELGLGERVHLLGQVSSVGGLLGAAEVFVSPGWSESFPYAILEAMSAGLPIVATDVGGVGEAIEDGVTGRLVPAHRTEPLAAAICDLLDDRSEAEGLGREARTRMQERFTFDAMVAGTLAVYRELGFR